MSHFLVLVFLQQLRCMSCIHVERECVGLRSSAAQKAGRLVT